MHQLFADDVQAFFHAYSKDVVALSLLNLSLTIHDPGDDHDCEPTTRRVNLIAWS